MVLSPKTVSPHSGGSKGQGRITTKEDVNTFSNDLSKKRELKVHNSRFDTCHSDYKKNFRLNHVERGQLLHAIISGQRGEGWLQKITEKVSDHIL